MPTTLLAVAAVAFTPQTCFTRPFTVVQSSRTMAITAVEPAAVTEATATAATLAADPNMLYAGAAAAAAAAGAYFYQQKQDGASSSTPSTPKAVKTTPAVAKKSTPQLPVKLNARVAVAGPRLPTVARLRALGGKCREL